MENKSKHEKALEDINLIKEIIQKTSTSMEAFSHIFITWGILFLILSLLLIMGMFIPVPGVRTDVIKFNDSSLISIASGGLDPLHIVIICLSYLIWPLFFFITRKLYKNTISTYPVKGVSKQLMDVWIYILILISLCFIIPNTYTNQFRITFLAVELILFALGLFYIYAFTKLRFPFILSIVYSLSGLFIMLSSYYNTCLRILLIPFTFLIIGFYFRQRERKVA
jgi:hypothetical protein